MAIVGTFGRRRLYIKFAHSPSWPEIADAFLPNQPSQMRPGATSRLSILKAIAHLKDISEDGTMGRVVSTLYVTDFRKIGLPRAPIIRILSDVEAQSSTADYAAVLSAVSQYQDKEPAPWNAVTQSMTNGLRGSMNPTRTCAVDGVCSAGSPEGIRAATVAVSGTPDRRLPDDGKLVPDNGERMAQ